MRKRKLQILVASLAVPLLIGIVTLFLLLRPDHSLRARYNRIREETMKEAEVEAILGRPDMVGTPQDGDKGIGFFFVDHRDDGIPLKRSARKKEDGNVLLVDFTPEGLVRRKHWLIIKGPDVWSGPPRTKFERCLQRLGLGLFVD